MTRAQIDNKRCAVFVTSNSGHRDFNTGTQVMRIFMGIHPRQIQTCCFSIQTFNSNILSCHLNLQLLN